MRLLLSAVALSLALCVVAAELSLRSAGHDPTPREPAPGVHPRMYDPDPILGWRSRPGEHEAVSHLGRTRVTVLPDGSRSTGAGESGELPEIVFIGASFTEGWGLSDEDTYLYKLQQRFPEVRIRNHAVGGYGTYQALLKLEELLEAPDLPDLVIYPLNQIHESRNVADPVWLKQVSESNLQGLVEVPYGTVGPRGGLLREAPTRYPSWPLRNHSVLVRWAEEKLTNLDGRERATQAREVTKLSVVAMARATRQKKVPFVVTILYVGEPGLTEYVQLLQEKHIRFFSCNFPVERERTLRGDGHPDEIKNSQWTDCYAKALASTFARLAETGPRA